MEGWQMKKMMALCLTLALIIGGAAPGLADSYEQQASAYLAQQLGVPQEQIKVSGSLQDLPLTGEQFWAGRYYIGEATPPSPPAASGDREEVPGEAGHSGGAIFIRIKTGEIMDYREAEPFFNAERERWEKEQEKLRQEAGRIEVGLYLKLVNASPDRLFTVIFRPLYVETEAMKKEIEKIYAAYPEFFPEEGVREFPGTVPVPGEVVVVPAVPPAPAGEESPPAPAGEASPAAPAGPIDPAKPAEAPTPSPLPAGGKDKTVSSDMVREPIKVEPDGENASHRDKEGDWERYQAMSERLQEIYRQGCSANLELLIGELEALGIEYEQLEPDPQVKATLPAGQLLAMKDRPYLEMIYDETTWPAKVVEDMASVPGSFNGLAEAAFEAEGEDNHKARQLYLVLGAVLILAGGFVPAIRRRKAATGCAD
jgi:hypothetical protein